MGSSSAWRGIPPDCRSRRHDSTRHGLMTPALVRPPGGDRARLTSRAAVLAVVICAIALSLAYPVREYIAQRRQIDQLQAQRQMLNGQLQALQHEQQRLADPAYIEQLARNKLHMCLKGQTCYVVIGEIGRASCR